VNISIFGLGYVGCVSLGCLAKNGHQVIGVDVNPVKIRLINQGKPTIIEKEIDKLIADNWQQGRILATQDYRAAVLKTEISILCVGTPSTPEGHLNLTAIFESAKQIGQVLREKDQFHTVVIRSTVLPGTNRKVGAIIEAHSGKTCNADFAVVSNPEFLREGTSVDDYFNPPVIAIGTDSPKAAMLMRKMYQDIEAPVAETPVEVAELIKYVSNAFHALKISFANEVGNICKKLEVDSHKVMNLFCLDRQLNISPYYLKPGFAYGGSCLPKDLKALQTLAHDLYISSPVLNSIHPSNENQKKRVIDMVLEKGVQKVGILGLSFKSGTDDLRYSPIVDVAEHLLGKGMSLRIYDRNVNISKLTGTNKQYIEQRIPHLSDLISDDLENVVGQSELIIIAHKEPEFNCINTRYPDKIFIDLVKIKDGQSEGNYEGICW
jgi:GDP-mannose 6-dehydrogenase